MALQYYKITNLSNDTKLFIYNSGSSEPGTEYQVYLQGLYSEEIVESFYPPFNVPIGIGEEIFLSDSFHPEQPGFAWLWNDGEKVKYIKITLTLQQITLIFPLTLVILVLYLLP